MGRLGRFFLSDKTSQTNSMIPMAEGTAAVTAGKSSESFRVKVPEAGFADAMHPPDLKKRSHRD